MDQVTSFKQDTRIPYLPTLQVVEINEIIRLCMGNLGLSLNLLSFLELLLCEHLSKTLAA